MTLVDIPDPDSVPDPASQGPSPSRWVRRTLVTLLVLGGGYLGSVFALSRLLDPARLADWVQPRLAAVVNRDVEIGEARVRLVPFEVQLRGVEVSDPTGMAPTLARVGSLGLRIEMIPLLRREVRVGRVTLESPELDLRVGSDGTSNFGDLSPEPRETPVDGDAPFSLELRNLRIEGGRFRYASQVDSTTVEVTDLEAQSTVRHIVEGPWLFEGAAGGVVAWTGSGEPTASSAIPVHVSFDVEADDDFQGLSVRSGAFRAEQVAFSVRGQVTDLREPVRRVALDLTLEDLPLERALAVAPDSVRERLGEVGGLLGAELHIEGALGPDVRPEVTGQGSLTGGRLAAADGSPLAEEVAGTLAVLADGSMRPSFEGTVLGGPASVEGTVVRGAKGTLDVVIRATPDLARLTSTGALGEGVELSGRIDADVRIAGLLADVTGLRFVGELRATDVVGNHPALGVPLAVSDGPVRLEGTRATFQDVALALGEDGMVASGEIRDLGAFLDTDRAPYLEGSVRGAHLSLLEIRPEPPADTTLTYGRVAFARVGGRSVQGRAPEDAAREMGLERPDSLPLAGRLEVRLDTLVDRRGTTEAVHAIIDFGPRHVRVTDVTFRRYGGELRSGFNLSLGADRAQPFTLTLQAQDVDAAAFLGATTPLGPVVQGTITLDFEVSGSLDALLLPTGTSLVGTGRYLVSGGGLRTTPVTQELATFLGIDALREPTIRNWGTSFILEDGILRLMDAVVDGAPGTPKVGGGIGLDGALDLLAAFDLPIEQLESTTLDRLGIAGDIVARLRERDDVVQAVLRIGGSVQDPDLQADPGAPARTLTEAAQEEAEAEVQSRIEEQKQDLEDRASGFLRGLLQRRDTAAGLPTDTIVPDTIPPDTLAVDSVPADTEPPDPVPPDTVRVS
jgi:hypothetical protein